MLIEKQKRKQVNKVCWKENITENLKESPETKDHRWTSTETLTQVTLPLRKQICRIHYNAWSLCLVQAQSKRLVTLTCVGFYA